MMLSQNGVKLKLNLVTITTVFSIYDQVLLYAERVVIALSLQIKDFKTIPCRTSGNSEDEVPDEKLCLLAKVEQRYPKYS